MSISYSKVKLISESFVKPKYEVKESKTPYYLIGEDLKLLSLRHSQSGFLYKKPSTCYFNMNAFVEKMKQAFSIALVYYYPLAGRFTTVKYEDENTSSIHVKCDNGPGARFIHASALGSVVHVSDIVGRTIGEVPIIREFFNLGETQAINYDGHTQALASLQLTELDDGVFLGIGINHSLFDGASLFHFVKSLSEIFRSDNNKTSHGISNIPIFKPVLPDGCNIIQKLPYLEPEKVITRVDNDPRLQERKFKFSSSSIAKLKSKANLECGGTDSKISSFQSLAALIWISIIKCKKVSSTATTTCSIPVDSRTRFNPPLSPNHIGNLAQVLRVTRNVGELLSNRLGWAANALHQDIAAYDDKAATQYLKEITENPTIMSLEEANKMGDMFNLVKFSCGARFDMYQIDFGLGKPVTTPGGNNTKRNGLVVVQTGSEGIGSVEIEVYLLPEIMSALEADQDFMAYVSYPIN